MKPHEQVAENVRAELARKSIKTVQVSGVLEITADAVRKKLNGINPFTMDEVAILANYLEISMAVFIAGVDFEKGAES